MAEPIAIAPIDDAEAEVWRLTREVALLLTGLPWVLIGGLMVRAAEAERGVTTTFTTGDVDIVLDVRAVSTATAEAATRLLAADFRPQPYGENLTYRFVRGNDDLDVIISVGYRVRSTRGTQFRIWATGILRDYLRRGYALNEKRLAALGIEAEQAIELPATTMEQQRLTSPEGAASWMSSDATRARGASCGRMTRTTSRPRQHKLVSRHRTDARRRAALPEHRIAGRASALFRRQGPPADRRNKRTASPLFLEYLRRNDALVRADGQLRSSDTALTALTLLVAESKPTHKDLVIRLVLNLLAEDRP